MPRVWTKNERVHRDLVTEARGEDVQDVQAAGARRLAARGYDDDYLPKSDGEIGGVSLARLGDALYALGAAPETVKACRAGKISIGAQRMIRYPGNRTDVQLARARNRKAEVRSRARATRKADGTFAPSGSVAARRARAAQAAKFALSHSGRRYSMGGDRWNPIASKANPQTGAMWTVADCSAFATWVLWHALDRGALADIVNGQGWRAGYTGTMVEHGRDVTNGHYQPGDCAIYGTSRSNTKHVVICHQAGTASTARWASHGSAGGPYNVGLHYRGDLVVVKRYLA
jgi:hypothetical protein